MLDSVMLEDSIGDILRKARISVSATLESVAAAAGLSTADYEKLEDSGRASKAIQYQAVARLLTLDAKKLERISSGWLPAPVDLSLWRELRVITTADPEDGMKVHAYLVWDEVTREAALFDTGFEADLIQKVVDENQLQLKHIFITHSHGDHVAALTPLRSLHPKARLHSSSKAAPAESRNRANDFINLGSLRITNRDTPGHADDGVTYVVGNWPEDASHVAIVGDAIFAGSIGGARDQLELARAKVREQIFSLPAETLICPGHGPLTTVGEEKANNPWFL